MQLLSQIKNNNLKHQTMATLAQLLTEAEIEQLKNPMYSLDYGNIDIEADIRDMTVRQLSSIALTLINTEYNGKITGCTLTVKALSILMKRARDRGIGIF